MAELQVYVKKYHTTGIVWNTEKKSAEFDPSKVGSTPVAPVPVQAAPPPPPPPMPDFAELLANDTKPAVVPINQLFAELNKGRI